MARDSDSPITRQPQWLPNQPISAAKLNGLAKAVNRMSTGVAPPFQPSQDQPTPNVTSQVMQITAINANTLTCNLYQNGAATQTAISITVARPYLLRNSVTSRSGITYTYSDTQTRSATDGSTTETQVIIPAYVVGDLINAVLIAGGTGVSGALWLDANDDGRAWARTGTGGSGFTAGGDLTGTSTSQTVAKIGGKAVSVANAGAIITTGDTGTVTTAMLAGSITASKLVGTDITTVGTLTAGATGAGFTVALSTSTITGTLAAARLPNSGVFTGDATTTFPALTIANAAITAAKMVNAGVFTGDATGTFPSVTLATVTIAKGGTNSTTALNNSKTMISSGGAIVESAGYQNKTATYTVAVSDHMSVIDVDASGSVNLPLIVLPTVASTNKGLLVGIRKADSSANVVPIWNQSVDAINRGFTNRGNGTPSNASLTYAGASNNVARSGTRALIITDTGNAPSLSFVIGGIITVAGLTGGNTALNGTWIIKTLGTENIGLSFATVGFDTDTSGTITANKDNGVSVTGVATWLTKQDATIWLMSTGTSGTAAKQGWVVVAVSGESLQGTKAATAHTGGSGAYNDGATIVVPPGEWEINAGTFVAQNGSAGGASAGLGISTTSGNSNAGLTAGRNLFFSIITLATSQQGIVVPPYRIVTTVQEIWYQKCYFTYTTTDGASFEGQISARRVG